MSLARVLAFSSAYIPISALVLAITVHLPRYFASHLGLSLAMVGGAFALVRLVDIPIDAALGVAMDRTRTRFGRYRPYLVLGVPMLMFALYKLLNSPSDVGQAYLVGWLLLMYLGYSCIYLAHLAWAGRIAASYEQRSRIFGAITGLGVVGSVGVVLIPIILTHQFHVSEAASVQAMIWFIIGGVPLTVAIVVLTTKETIAADHSKGFSLRDYLFLLSRGNVIRILLADFLVTLGPGWMAALYLFYFTDRLGFSTAAANFLLLIYIAAGFAGAPLVARLGGAISKHWALILSTSVYSLGLVGLPFMPKGAFFLVAPMMFILGGFAAGFSVMIRAITADIADEVRLQTGREWMGLMYALTTATTKLATAGSIFLTFNVLARVGYQAKEGATNTPEAIRGLELAYIIGPIVFVMLAGACFLGYRLTATRHAEIRRELELRDAEVTSGSS